MAGNSGLGSRFRFGEFVFICRSIHRLFKEARAKGHLETAREIVRGNISELRAAVAGNPRGVGGHLSEVHEIDRESRESERVRILRNNDRPPRRANDEGGDPTKV